LDPITAFAAAQSALVMIRKGVDFYKECKKASADVTEITSEVSGYIGKFLDAKHHVEIAARKAKEESEQLPENGKPVSINTQALNNVMMQIQLENAEKELREMLIYNTPGLNDVWTRFEKERARLFAVQLKQLEQQQERQRIDRLLAADRAADRRRKLAQVWDEAYMIIGIIVFVATYWGCMYLIVQDRIQQYPELGTCFIPKGSIGYKTYNNLRWVNCELKTTQEFTP
jgi:hypothetical protein